MITTKTSTAFLAAAGALFLAAGCCPTAPVPVSASGDVNQAAPAPQAGRAKRTPALSQVEGELVYNLGQGVIANSEAVVLSGGYAKPRAARLVGGVAGCCPNPVPQVYLDAVRDSRPLATAPVTPVATPATEPWDAAATAAGFCAPAACPTPADSVVCTPGDNLTECFTLTEAEAAEAKVYVPKHGVALDVEATALERVEAAGKEAALTPPVVEAASNAPAATPAPAVAEVPAAPVAAVVDEPETAAVTDEIMPPVPDAADFDAAIDAILSRDGVSTASSLPEVQVQLPPQLQ